MIIYIIMMQRRCKTFRNHQSCRLLLSNDFDFHTLKHPWSAFNSGMPLELHFLYSFYFLSGWFIYIYGGGDASKPFHIVSQRIDFLAYVHCIINVNFAGFSLPTSKHWWHCNDPNKNKSVLVCLVLLAVAFQSRYISSQPISKHRNENVIRQMLIYNSLSLFHTFKILIGETTELTNLWTAK